LVHGSGKDLVGIDFSGSSLKIVHLKSSLNKKELSNIASHNISGMPDEDIARLIASSFKELKVKDPLILNIVPPQAVITKNIEIPSVDQQEIREIINLQAGRHTPYSREEIIVDYIEIGTYKNSYTKILLVIVARAIVKKQLEILQKAGIKLEKVLLGAESLSWALKNVFRQDTSAFPVSLMHVDENYTDFIIVFKDKPLFIRNIPVGTQHLLAEKERYQLKMLDELKRSLEAYSSEDIEKSPNMIVLTGAIDEVLSLEKLLNESFHIPTKSISYFKFFPLPPSIVKSASSLRNVSFFNVISALYSVSQMKVNLIPEEIKLRKLLEERGRELIKSGILILAVFVLVFLVLITKIYFNTAYLNKLDVKYKALSQEAGKLEGDFSKISLIRNYLASRGFSLEVLTELYSATPEDLELSDIRFDEQGKFFIRGTAEAMSSVFSFADNMQKSKYFKEVKTRYTTKRKEGASDVTDFEISCLLVNKAN
jgi:type IV pilus assembly protein PilM